MLYGRQLYSPNLMYVGVYILSLYYIIIIQYPNIIIQCDILLFIFEGISRHTTYIQQT